MIYKIYRFKPLKISNCLKLWHVLQRPQKQIQTFLLNSFIKLEPQMGYASLFVVLFLTFGSSVVRSQCGTNPAVTLLSAPIPSPNIITFDNIGLQDMGEGIGWLSGASGPRDISTSENQTIFVYGNDNDNLCFLTKGVTIRPSVTWSGADYWSGSTTEKPGFYIMTYDRAFCGLRSIPPISAFVARVVSAAISTTPSYLQIYSDGATMIDCIGLPNVPGTNTYSTIGFTSTIPIEYVVFTTSGGPTFMADNVQWITCSKGFFFDATDCVGKK